MVEVNTPEQIDIKDSNITTVYTDNIVNVEKATDLDIRVVKKEYSIVGDDIYIPKLYDDAPQWMKDLVSVVVDVSIATESTDLINQLNSTLSTFATSYVPLNQYTQSIVSLQDADTAINSLITTLNSTFNDGVNNLSAQVINLQSTKANASEVVAQVISTINSELTSPTSNLNATIGNLQQTIANESSARAANFETISSTLETLDGEISGNSSAVMALNTYVGIENGTANGTGLLADVEILQKQNDGIIETTTGTYDVMINPQDPNLAQLVVSAEPYATWKAQDVTGIDTRLAHIGDVYIKYNTTSNGAREYVASYKFIRTIVDSTSPYATDSDGFTWALIVDQAAQDAYQQALNAYDLADNKRRVFTTTPTGSIDEGDLWVTGTNPQVVKVYKSGNWELSDTQVDNFISVTYTPTITSLQNQIDGKIESWYTVSTNDPKTAWTDAQTRAKHDGDMWYQTDTKLSYYYSSSTNSWNLIDDAKAIQALADAATAQATADGKISSYYMNTLAAANVMSNTWTATEKANNVGDLVVVWNDSTLDNNGTWRWNGTSWVTTRDKKLIALASDVTNLSTELNNGTNTWAGADSTLENSLRTEITDEGARVESKFAYNSNVNINGVWKKSGFGLTANYVSGSGTKADPYVSEFWIDASRFKFTNSNQTGQVAPFTIDASGPQPQVTFNGKVTFGSGQTGTIDEAIAAVVETVAVGDKNINITDNLIPTTSLVADTENSGYQFVGTPVKSMTAGLESFSEAQIALNGLDEVYSPYVDEVTIPYYYRFGVKGITNLNRFKIVTINSSNVVLYNDITVTMEAGQSLSADSWYTVDGIINPIGGTTTADGDIRDINGIKVGSIDNFVITSGTTKILLGWIADCTISRMKMCKITADTITSDFSSVNGQLTNLQNQIDNVDVSWNNLSGKDVFAQKLGYSTYAALEAAATAGETVVVGGKINTGLIEANAINANQINTVGLIAENISANEIVGKTITGSILNGASINGAVIKASYLDLDGELEVLTNYHITPAMYNANPSLYTDAVYISGSNEYRIPSISTVRESTVSYSTAGVSTYYGVISSYNTANVGNNLKAVKIRPIWNNQVAFQLVNSVCSDSWFGYNFTYGIKNHFKISLGNINLIECKVELLSGGDPFRGEDDTTTVTITGQGFNPIGISIMSAYNNNDFNNTYSLNIGIGILSLTVIISGGSYTDAEGSGTAAPNTVSIIGTLTTGTNTLPFDWISGKLKFEQLVAPSKSFNGSTNEKTTFSLNQSLYINNMI